MAYHGVIIPEAIAATNVDSYVRNVVSASALDNGFLVYLRGKSSTAGQAEVFTAEVPFTGSLTDLWMVYDGEEIAITDSKYKGLDPDPRNAYTAAGKVVSAYKVMKGDIILATSEALSASRIDSSYGYLLATTDTMKLTWSTSPSATVACYRLLATKYISLATGGIDSQRVTAYEIECIVS